MKRFAVLFVVALWAAPVMADVTMVFNDPFATDKDGWLPDRYASSIFDSGATGGGRTGVLHQGVRAADSQANRTGGYVSDTYNVQGYKYTTNLMGPGVSTSMDLYVDSNWLAGTRVIFMPEMNNNNRPYPVIEYVVNADNSFYGGSKHFTGFRWWQYGVGWSDGIDMAADNRWHNLSVVLGVSDLSFIVDGTQLGTVSNLNATGFKSVILNVYNQGAAGEYDVYWDNFRAGSAAPVPAPGALLLAGLGTGLVGWLRRRKA